jgi:hypothetical protein
MPRGDIARDGRFSGDVDGMSMEAAMIELTRQQVETLEMSKRFTVSDDRDSDPTAGPGWLPASSILRPSDQRQGSTSRCRLLHLKSSPCPDALPDNAVTAKKPTSACVCAARVQLKTVGIEPPSFWSRIRWSAARVCFAVACAVSVLEQTRERARVRLIDQSWW